MQKLASDRKNCLTSQDIIQQSENHHKNVIQTVSDLMESPNEYIDGSHALDDGFALEYSEKNDYALNGSGKVSTRLAGRSHVVNYVVNTGGVMLDNGVSTTTCKKKDDNFVNDEICYFIKEELEQTNFAYSCTTFEPNFSLPSGFGRLIKNSPCTSSHSDVQGNNETFTNYSLIQLGGHKVSENVKEKYERIEDCSTARTSTNTKLDTNKKKRSRSLKKANLPTISKISRRHLQVYTCQFCNKSCKTFTNFVCHIRKHVSERPYVCDICSKRFKLESALKNHLRVHTGNRPYSCDLCSKRFTQDSKLKAHLRIHAGERPYKCEMCSKRFTRSSTLKAHLRIHAGERPYKCEVCSKRFTRTSTLKRHLRIHTGERPYKCDVCSKRFNQNSALKYHITTHTSERPYKCDICSKRFKQDSALNRHMRIHTGERSYKCEICLKQFTHGSGLKKHIKIHTDERPYECAVCSKRFKQDSDLKRHMRIHTGERPYKCEICSKQFIDGSGLRRHMRIHTGKRSYECDVC